MIVVHAWEPFLEGDSCLNFDAFPGVLVGFFFRALVQKALFASDPNVT